MEGYKHYINGRMIIPEDEYAKIASFIFDYENGIININELKGELNYMGIKLELCFRQSDCIYGEKGLELIRRYDVKTDEYVSFEGYLLTGNGYKNALVKCDREMLEVLTYYGDEKARKMLEKLTSLEEVHASKRQKLSDVKVKKKVKQKEKK